MILLLLILCPLIVADPLVYLHPVNPKLYPKDMYPIQRSVRGFNKVRDLPQSGVVYIGRIKPLSDEFRGAAVARASNTFVKNENPAPLKEFDMDPQKSYEVPHTADDSANVRQSSVPIPLPSSADGIAELMEEQPSFESTTPEPVTTTEEATTTPTIIERTTTEEMEFTSQTPRPEKNLLKIAISKKTKEPQQPKELDLSRESEISLERLIAEIKQQEMVDLIHEHPAVATIDMPRATVSGAQMSRPGNPGAKLISLSGTASVHAGEMVRKPSNLKLVQLKRKKFGIVGGSTSRKGADFDPWERMGQK
ncbi:hypothetical protein OESDEN_09040 [Oesophagostomum dentatum]|uniref:Uncharacterized protein n=1 Tax=Oesophagostomum dentatum TaxID=61180 RepID=A0A0B1T6V3_OESDE|nr:hypothetical protein OESDEN_09040 [Oesophagostomum dentatum]